MIAIDNQSLLCVWEEAALMQPAQRSLFILSSLIPHSGYHSITVGERNRQLMVLRQHLFGDKLDAISYCPTCKARTEVEFFVSDFLSSFSEENLDQPPDSPHESHHGDFRVRWTLPTARDVAELSSFSNVASARESLLKKCLVEVLRDNAQVDVAHCPTDLVEFISGEIDRLAPLTDTTLRLKCPDCELGWESPFEIGQFLWSEIDTYSRNLLNDVHLLATAYGWDELSILGLSNSRRRYYLELIAA